MSIVSEFVSIFIHQVPGKGKKDVHHRKEFALAVGKGAGESVAGPAQRYMQRRLLWIGYRFQSRRPPCKQEVEAPEVINA